MLIYLYTSLIKYYLLVFSDLFINRNSQFFIIFFLSFALFIFLGNLNGQICENGSHQHSNCGSLHEKKSSIVTKTTTEEIAKTPTAATSITFDDEMRSILKSDNNNYSNKSVIATNTIKCDDNHHQQQNHRDNGLVKNNINSNNKKKIINCVTGGQCSNGCGDDYDDDGGLCGGNSNVNNNNYENDVEMKRCMKISSEIDNNESVLNNMSENLSCDLMSQIDGGGIDDDDMDPYMQLEEYLEKVKVSNFFLVLFVN